MSLRGYGCSHACRFSYTAVMSSEFNASRLDVKAFAQAGGVLSGHDLLSKYARLLAETGGQGV